MNITDFIFIKPKNAENNYYESYNFLYFNSSTEIWKSLRDIINLVSIHRDLLFGSSIISFYVISNLIA